MGLLDNIHDEKPQDDCARTLIHGQPGTGKTSLAATMAELGKTLFLYVPGEEGIGSLRGVDHEDNLTTHRLSSIRELDDIYIELFKGDHSFDVVVLDSVSALQTMWKKALLGLPLDAPARERPSTDYSFWGALVDGFTDFFTYWYALAGANNIRPVHVAMTSQTKMLDDSEGSGKMQPDLHKGPLGAAVSRPDQILYTHMVADPEDFEKQRHVVRIKPSASVVAKTRCSPQVYGGLPEVLGLRGRVTLPKYLTALRGDAATTAATTTTKTK
jgi:hypothetical protein